MTSSIGKPTKMIVFLKKYMSEPYYDMLSLHRSFRNMLFKMFFLQLFILFRVLRGTERQRFPIHWLTPGITEVAHGGSTELNPGLHVCNRDLSTQPSFHPGCTEAAAWSWEGAGTQRRHSAEGCHGPCDVLTARPSPVPGGIVKFIKGRFVCSLSWDLFYTAKWSFIELNYICFYLKVLLIVSMPYQRLCFRH